MSKLPFIFLLFITSFGYSQNQESEPTFYSEIAERVAPKTYYSVKFGNPAEVIVNDTIFMTNSETWIEKNIYSFKSSKEMLVKKYRDSGVIDKKEAIFLIVFCLLRLGILLLTFQVKRSLALLESNQSRDRLDDRQKCQEKGAQLSPFF